MNPPDSLDAGVERPAARLPRRTRFLVVLAVLSACAALIAASWINGLVADPLSLLAEFYAVRSYWLAQIAAMLLGFALPHAAVLCLESGWPRVAAGWAAWLRRAAPAIACAGMCLFIYRYGNRQFGGYDHSIIVDVGWRLWNGQRPYVDFICTLPPGFFLGIQYAFRWFGPAWNSQLILAGVFASLTFLWMYWLLERLLAARLMAYVTALAVECTAILVAAFWWHNSIASTAACVFLLSCAYYIAAPASRSALVSFALAAFLLALMKPNIALPLELGGISIALACAPGRKRLAAAMLLAAAGLYGFLVWNHVPLSGLVQSYATAAADRGRVWNLIGIRNLRGWDFDIWVGCTAMLLLPAGLWVRRLQQVLRPLDLRAAGFWLAIGLGPVAALLGFVSNLEIKFVDMAPLICFGAVAAFGGPAAPNRQTLPGKPFDPFSVRYLACLCCVAAAACCAGSARYRVAGIGNHSFFYWRDGGHQTGEPFFRDLRASSRFRTVMAQVREATRGDAGQSVFFGPRMEFEYAVCRLPSPKHLPIWWHPGSSYGLADERAVLAEWKNQSFDTLIFLKHDFSFYPPAFRDMLRTLYVTDDRYSELTVLHRM